ncbi:hypothetical protein [Fibrobacter sp.]|uniref:hypothetical protein n=1 Tax=Fibrobacter sp. TaxID=35828 RepID=UPI00388FE109
MEQSKHPFLDVLVKEDPSLAAIVEEFRQPIRKVPTMYRIPVIHAIRELLDEELKFAREEVATYIKQMIGLPND